MKKSILFIAFIIAVLKANAQINKDTVGLNLPVKDGNVMYTGVVAVEGKTKDDLYKNALQWFMDYFSNEKNVIQDNNREDGILFARCDFYFSSKVRLEVVNWTNHVTIKIECKDNKYRYSFYNMVINEPNNGGFDMEQVLGAVLGTRKWAWSKDAAKNALIDNDEVLKNIILSLKKAMVKTTTDF